MAMKVRRPWAAYSLTAGIAIWTLSALGGGPGLFLAPDGSGLGFDPAILRNTPFADFLLPGLILALLGAVGAALTALLVRGVRARGRRESPLSVAVVLRAGRDAGPPRLDRGGGRVAVDTRGGTPRRPAGIGPRALVGVRPSERGEPAPGVRAVNAAHPGRSGTAGVRARARLPGEGPCWDRCYPRVGPVSAAVFHSGTPGAAYSRFYRSRPGRTGIT